MSVHAVPTPEGLRRASDLTRVGDDAITSSPLIAAALPWRGLRRGSTVAVPTVRPGVTSLLLALLAGPSSDGSWCAIVGGPAITASAMRRSGVDASRLALIPDPGPRWETVAGALLDGVDVVAVYAPGSVPHSRAARLSAKARGRRSVLIPVGAPDWSSSDVVLAVEDARWTGLSSGRGMVRGCELTVATRFRGRRTTTIVRPYGAPRPEDVDRLPTGVVSLDRHRRQRQGGARAVLRPQMP